MEFSSRYNTPEVNEAIIELARWYNEKGTDFAPIFKAQFLGRDPNALAINQHRRVLNRYYVDIAKAYRIGVLDRRFAIMAADHPGARIWKQVVCPMTIALHGHEMAASLVTLSALMPKFGDGAIY